MSNTSDQNQAPRTRRNRGKARREAKDAARKEDHATRMARNNRGSQELYRSLVTRHQAVQPLSKGEAGS